MKKEYIIPQAEAVILIAGNTMRSGSIASGGLGTEGETDAPTRRYRPI